MDVATDWIQFGLGYFRGPAFRGLISLSEFVISVLHNTNAKLC